MMGSFFGWMLAGLCAGVELGFAGVSAATVVAPILIALLGYPWYEAVGIGLTADVLAAASSAYIYKKNKNVDLRAGVLMLVCVLVMTFVGSYFSQYLPNTEMGWISIAFSFFMGMNFLLKKSDKQNKKLDFINQNKRLQTILSILVGCFIGFWCGLFGAGGGMMMLFGLVCIMGYDLKLAVGTGVFVMTFTAGIGAVSHFYYGDMFSYLPAVVWCSIFTLVGTFLSSILANRMEQEKTTRVTGIILLALCAGLVIKLVVSG